MLKRKRKETVSSQEADAQNNSVIALINSITDAVFSINQDGAIKTYNSAALNLLDTNEDIVGKNICDLMNLETENKKPFNVLQELAKSRRFVNATILSCYSQKETNCILRQPSLRFRVMTITENPTATS